jgi:hypothetical protein
MVLSSLAEETDHARRSTTAEIKETKYFLGVVAAFDIFDHLEYYHGDTGESAARGRSTV